MTKQISIFILSLIAVLWGFNIANPEEFVFIQNYVYDGINNTFLIFIIYVLLSIAILEYIFKFNRNILKTIDFYNVLATLNISLAIFGIFIGLEKTTLGLLTTELVLMSLVIQIFSAILCLGLYQSLIVLGMTINNKYYIIFKSLNYRIGKGRYSERFYKTLFSIFLYGVLFHYLNTLTPTYILGGYNNLLFIFNLLISLVLLIYLILNSGESYYGKACIKVRKEMLLDFTIDSELLFMEPQLKSSAKKLASKEIGIIDLIKLILKNREDYYNKNKEVRKSSSKRKKDFEEYFEKIKVKVKIPRELEIYQSYGDSLKVKGDTKEKVILSYNSGEDEQLSIREFNTLIKGASIQKQFFNIIEDKHTFLESFITSEINSYKTSNNIKSSEDLPTNIKGLDNISALVIFSGKGFKDKLQDLINNNPEINLDSISKDTGYTALAIGVAENHIDIVKLLLEKGAHPDVKTNTHGAAAIHFAAKYGFLDMIKLLLEYGADINIKDNYGSTSLLHSIEFDHDNVTEFLIKKGINTSNKNIYKQDAKSMAKKQKKGKILKLLR